VKTPATLGYRYPAEWERHEATWLGWPHNTSDWPGKFAPIPWVFAEMARKISEGESVRIIVRDAAHEKGARRALENARANLKNIEFFRYPTNRGWTRDFGPMFVRGPKAVAILDYRFNAWAKYPDWQLDNAVPGKVAKRLGYKTFSVTLDGRLIVLEGGALDANGAGALLTTEECLMDQVTQCRNPGLTRPEMDRVFREYFGVKNVYWLGRGIAGDDTHGHVDDLCRFVNSKTVVLVQEKNPLDDNYSPLAENWERIQDWPLDVVALPMPEPLYFEGRRLPASYANFYICNAAVLVPTFNDPNDRLALGIISELITDRPVIGIHAVDLVWGLGTIHCLTREQPAV
jgi:agmatine deiminase